MADLFSSEPATDQLYVKLREPTVKSQEQARHFAETLWRQFEPFADPHFLVEIRSDFHARFWEMYLTCSLLQQSSQGRYRVSCPKPGPDILLEHEGHRIWIEAIIATNGDPGRPDSVVEPSPDGKIPEEKLVLRYTAAIREKHNKYVHYLDRGFVHGNDAFVIAINSAFLGYKWAWAEVDAPRFLKALYPIGQLQVLLDRGTREVVGHQNEPRFHIEKSRGAHVPTTTFLDQKFAAINAILSSYADVGTYDSALGRDFEVAYNPSASRPISPGTMGEWRAWEARLSEDGGELSARRLID